MKRKINALAVAVFIALSALIPAGCSNTENTVSENPSENSVVEAQETIVETSSIINHSTEDMVSVLPSENQKKSDSGSEEEHSEISTKPESSELHSGIEDSSSPSASSAASESSEIEKEASNTVLESVSGSEEHSEPEKQNSIPKTETSIAEQVSHISIEPEQPTSHPVAAASVTLNHSNLSMTVGDKVRLTAAISPADTDDRRLTWEWSDDSVIRIDSTGTVSAIGVGKATITVKTANGKKSTCKVTVISASYVPETSVKLNTKAVTISKGKTYTLKATVSPSNASNKKVTWSSSNTSVATVSSSGVVTAKKAGTVTITAKTYIGKTATCKVTVKGPPVAVTGIKLNASKLTMTAGTKYTLKATITPSNATNKNVSWSSSDPKVAGMGAGGVINAKKKGTCTITAKTNNGKTATCKLTVK